MVIFLLKAYVTSIISTLVLINTVDKKIIENTVEEASSGLVNPNFIKLCAILMPIANTYITILLLVMGVNHLIRTVIVRSKWAYRKIKRRYK